MFIPSKKQLLKKYKTKEPKAFIQFDTFLNLQDDLITNDENGLGLSCSTVCELMSGEPIVRVLILPNTSKDICVKALKKISDRVKKEDILEKASKGIEESIERRLKLEKFLTENAYTIDEVQNVLGLEPGDEIPF